MSMGLKSGQLNKENKDVQEVKKSRIVIAVEIVDEEKVGNAYAQLIKDFSTESLKEPLMTITDL